VGKSKVSIEKMVLDIKKKGIPFRGGEDWSRKGMILADEQGKESSFSKEKKNIFNKKRRRGGQNPAPKKKRSGFHDVGKRNERGGGEKTFVPIGALRKKAGDGEKSI